jgi:CDP-glycerol glycerophosphotransferase (TagB/SpsB family)
MAIFQKIINSFPQPIKKIIFYSKKVAIDPYHKKFLVKNMMSKHQQLLKKIRGKEKVRVVFIAMLKSMWNLDSVFHKMLDDPSFDPVILVCPYTEYDERRMWQELEDAYEYFVQKGYPVFSSYNNSEKRWVELDEYKPDLLFFNRPHGYTKPQYYKGGYTKFLSCFVNYTHEIDNKITQYDLKFHNAQWMIFAGHEYALEMYKKLCHTQGRNVRVTGYSKMEELLEAKRKRYISDPWKSQDERLRIIWAPHHSIKKNEWGFSNFIEYAEQFKKLSTKYKSNVVWSFKPHPSLKSKLYLHPSWGKKKTDEYYGFWASQGYTQLETGLYTDLFWTSDAMIHDCGSFLAEYLYVRKPVLHLFSKVNKCTQYNGFGLKALEACRHGRSFCDVERFVSDLVNKKITGITEDHARFYDTELIPYFDQEMPSDRIIKMLKKELVLND